MRNIAGSLLETSRGNLEAGAWRALVANSGRKAGPTAPAKGLFLVGVEYKDQR